MLLSELISDQINNNQPFAFIRLPKEENAFLIIPDSTGKNTYIFNSFDSSKKYEFHFSDFQEIPVSELTSDLSVPLSHLPDIAVNSKQQYLELLKRTISLLKEKKAHKIVISRQKWMNVTEIHPVQSFDFLCKKYPDSFCHLSYWNKDEIWLGATPETLGTFENSVFQTMSLAGTLPNEDSFLWTEKEIQEQRMVTEYIHEILKKYSTYITVDGPNTLYLRNIKHLVTYFSIHMEKDSPIPQLLQELHPTPAVCGLPLETSKKFILKEEGYTRDFYAGYIGIKKTDSEKYFVNLRCGKLFQNGALLYAGGGITAQSDPEKEWEETELKSRFVGDSL